jgi:hypothetical protein
MEQQGTFYGKISDLQTTFTFSNDSTKDMIKSDKGDIFIYGIPETGPDFTSDITRREKNGFHLGLFYADFSPQSAEKGETLFIGKKEIKQMNLDFFALGRNHNFRLFRFSERILGAYPGSPEPCSLDECGERFVISLEVDGNKITSFRRIPVNTITINSHEIDCTSFITEKELIKAIKDSGTRDTMNRIELRGSRNFATGRALKEELTGYYRGLKVIDKTDIPWKVFMDESSMASGLKGMFFRNLAEAVRTNSSHNPDYNLVKKIFSDSGNNAGGILFCDS